MPRLSRVLLVVPMVLLACSSASADGGRKVFVPMIVLDLSSPTPTPPTIAQPTATPQPVPTERPSDSYRCSDFPSQAAAQRFLRQYPSDPSGLDRDRDGIACESNPPPVDLTPVPR